MKRISSEKPPFLKQLFFKIFIDSHKSPELFEIFLVLSEILLFTMFISTRSLDSDSDTQTHFQNFPSLSFEQFNNNFYLSFEIVILLMLVINLFVRIFFMKTFIKGIYILCIITAESLTEQSNQWSRIAIWVLITINLISEMLANCEYEFSSENFYSETLNSTKFFHYISTVFCTLLRIHEKDLFHEGWICPTISICLFTFLVIIKFFSYSRNPLCQQLHIRFYFMTVCFYATNIILFWENSLEETYRVIINIIVSQLAITLIKMKVGKIRMAKLFAEKKKQSMCFRILSYQFGFSYSEQYEKIINQLTGNCPRDYTIPSSIDFKFENKDKGLYEMGKKIQELLENKDSFQALFINAQIRFHIMKQPIKVKKQINTIKNVISEKSTLYNFPLKIFQKLLLVKFERKFQTLIQDEYHINQLICSNELLDNQILRNLLMKLTLEYVSLWQLISSNSNKKQIVYKIIIKNIEKILTRQEQFQQQFRATKTVCKDLIINYIEYLYFVERNVQEANKLSRDFWIFPELHNFLKLDEKIYLSVCLDQENFMTVENTSYNIKKLLGYNRNLVKGQNVSMFVPQFYKKYHEINIEAQIFNNDKNFLFNFHKETIVRHNLDYYLPLQINLKIVYNPIDGRIFLEGFLKIIQDNSYYDWTNFFFVSVPGNQLKCIGGVLKEEYKLDKDIQILCSDVFNEETAKQTKNEFSRHEAQRPRYFYSKGSQQDSERFNKDQLDKKYYCVQNIKYEYHFLLEMAYSSKNSSKFYVAKKNTIFNDYIVDQSAIYEDEKDAMSENEELMGQKNFHKFPLLYDDFESNLPNYFQKTDKVFTKLNVRTLCISLIVIIFLFVAMIAMQSFLIVKISDYISNNQEFIMDFEYTKNHSFFLNELSMLGNLYSLFFFHGYPRPQSNQSEQFLRLALQLQKTSEYLVKFNSETYNSTSDTDIQRIQDMPKSAKIIINELGALPFTTIYYFELDIMRNALHQLQLKINEIYSGIAETYIVNYMNSVASRQNSEKMLRIINMVGLSILPIAIALIVLKKMKYLNNLEFQAVNSIVMINTAHIFLNYAHQFIRKFVGSISQQNSTPFLPHKITSNFQKSQQKPWQDSRMLVLSSRENSVRNLIEDVSTTNRVCEEEQNQPEDNNLEEQAPQTIVTSIPKKYVALLIIATCIIAAHSIVFVISFQGQSQSDASQSAENLGNILQKQAYFSSTIITFITKMTGNAREGLFENNLKNYRQIENKPDEQFFEISLPQFHDFAGTLEQMKYRNICEYMECDLTFASELNIVYKTAIHKMNLYMESHQNISEVTDRTMGFQTLIYSQNLTKNVADRVLNSYVGEYKTYVSGLSSGFITYNYLNSFLIFLFSIVIFGVMELFWLRNKKLKIKKIIEIILKQSYEDNSPQTQQFSSQNEPRPLKNSTSKSDDNFKRRQKPIKRTSIMEELS